MRRDAEIVFTMGTPAAGKSTWAKANIAETHEILDIDDLNQKFPGYDPSDPDVVEEAHHWARPRYRAMVNEAIESGEGRWVIDSTGTNREKMERIVTAAREAGFETRLVYVWCSLETSLRRNAARERTVPERVIREKAETIGAAYEHYREELFGEGAVTFVDNDADWGERRAA